MLPSFTTLLLLQLARAGTVGSQGAKLLLEVSERVRTLTQAYFSPERPLHLSFTHLVCRSAIEGNCQGPHCASPLSGPCWVLTVLSTPNLHGFLASLHKGPNSPAQARDGFSAQL